MARGTHKALIEWSCGDADFLANRYSRAHRWIFDGLEVAASSSPSVVPVPFSLPENIDPEEAFVASVSSCHMLWFLDFARREDLVVETYRDAAIGTMGKTESGAMCIKRVELSPEISWRGKIPERPLLEKLHEAAHHHCFIANSVRSEIVTNIGG